MRSEHQLRCRVEEHERCAVVRPDGVLGHATYPLLRDTMLKCAVEEPKALIVDLSDVTIADQTALSVFTTVWLRISDWPAIPVLVATGPVHADLLQHAPIRRYVGVFGSVQAALANVDQPPPGKRAFRALPNHPSTPYAARQFVRQTCSAWGLPDALTLDAVHVASELVQNTIQHTFSEARLRLELRHGLFTVAVGDDSPAPAVLTDPGNDAANAMKGIRLVAQLARTWGCVPDLIASRKTVWAVLGEPRPEISRRVRDTFRLT